MLFYLLFYIIFNITIYIGLGPPVWVRVHNGPDPLYSLPLDTFLSRRGSFLIFQMDPFLVLTLTPWGPCIWNFNRIGSANQLEVKRFGCFHRTPVCLYYWQVWPKASFSGTDWTRPNWLGWALTTIYCWLLQTEPFNLGQTVQTC